MRKYEHEIIELRNKGYSFAEIGKQLNVSRQYVSATYNHLCKSPKRITKKQMELIDRIKYVNIRNYLKENNITVVEFCSMCGEHYYVESGMAKFLFGKSGCRIEYIKQVLLVTKMTFEFAFQE